jgi:hypothetical protein
MEVSSAPTNGIFSLHVLIILGITVALVSAVAVILYNKIQQQGEKLSAVMELSTVLAQEVRAHDIFLKRLQVHESPQQPDRHATSSFPSPQLNTITSHMVNDTRRVHVSDGSGSSDDDDSVEEVHLNISQPPSTTLDNMLMNHMCIGHAPVTNVDSDVYDSEESCSGDESDSTDNDDESCDSLSVLSDQLISAFELENDVTDITEIDISNSSSHEKRVITLTDISIDALNEGDDDLVEMGGEEDDTDADIHKVMVDSGDNVLEYKKLSVNELRRLAIERKLLDKGSKMKKGPLIELLTNV